MNKQRLIELAEWLEAGAPHKYITFDMNKGLFIEAQEAEDLSDINRCETSCCIAGAAVMFFNDPQEMLKREMFAYHMNAEDVLARGGEMELNFANVMDEAMELLDIGPEDAAELFRPRALTLDEVNDPQLAAKVIRNFIATECVAWRELMEETA